MAEPVCPYCRMPFDEASPPRIFCTACGMPHHEDCYMENGGCTVFGCKRAPADEPKVQVAQSDLSAVSVPAQQYAPVAQLPPWCSSPLPYKAINRRVTAGRWVYRKRPPRRLRRFQSPRQSTGGYPIAPAVCLRYPYFCSPVYGPHTRAVQATLFLAFFLARWEYTIFMPDIPAARWASFVLLF